MQYLQPWCEDDETEKLRLEYSADSSRFSSDPSRSHSRSATSLPVRDDGTLPMVDSARCESQTRRGELGRRHDEVGWRRVAPAQESLLRLRPGAPVPFQMFSPQLRVSTEEGSVLEPRAPQMHSDQARSLVLDGQRCKRDCQHLHVTKPMPTDVQWVASTLRRVYGAFSPSRSATSFVGRGALREGWGASIGENKICNSWFFTRSSN